MKKILILPLIICLTFSLVAQEKPVDVVDMTIKLKGTKELYYGFEKGDKIILNLEEEKDKEIKGVQIYRYPDNLKYATFKISSIKNKEISVEEKGVYQFVFTSTKKRLCQIKIQRQPKLEETIDFNTAVNWIERPDTTFKTETEDVTVGYDTYNVQKKRKVLANEEKKLTEVLITKERVHSRTYIGGKNISWVNFSLPKNSYYPNQNDPYKSTETIAWAYSIIAEGEGEKWYKKANTEALATEGGQLAVAAGWISQGYAAIGLLALKGYSTFADPPKGENIKYQLITSEHGEDKIIEGGDCVLISKRHSSDYLQGDYQLRLENDNILNGINVNVKVYAVQLIKTYKDESYTVQEKSAVKEKQIRQIPKSVEMIKIPVNAD